MKDMHPDRSRYTHTSTHTRTHTHTLTQFHTQAYMHIYKYMYYIFHINIIYIFHSDTQKYIHILKEKC